MYYCLDIVHKCFISIATAELEIQIEQNTAVSPLKDYFILFNLLKRRREYLKLNERLQFILSYNSFIKKISLSYYYGSQ